MIEAIYSDCACVVGRMASSHPKPCYNLLSSQAHLPRHRATSFCRWWIRAGTHGQIFDQICLANMFGQTYLIMCTPNLTLFVFVQTQTMSNCEYTLSNLSDQTSFSNKFDQIFAVSTGPWGQYSWSNCMIKYLKTVFDKTNLIMCIAYLTLFDVWTNMIVFDQTNLFMFSAYLKMFVNHICQTIWLWVLPQRGSNQSNICSNLFDKYVWSNNFDNVYS